MNKRYAVFALAALCACHSSSFKPTYSPSTKGTTTGAPVTQMIDATGGKVVAADGRLELTVPAGTFTSPTPVSIQPITNTAPNGLGPAYRLSPEGTTFTQPVTLAFHATATQAQGLDHIFIATQKDDGLWYSQPGQARDAAAQTVTLGATHFSDYALVETLLLTPQQTRVKVGASATFTATIVLVKEDDDELVSPGDQLAIPTPQNLENQLSGHRGWSVNGISGGNATVGTIADPGGFVAPTTKPSPSSEAITITQEVGTTKILATAEADIYSAETWSGNSEMTETDGTRVHATFTFEQTGTEPGGRCCSGSRAAR